MSGFAQPLSIARGRRSEVFTGIIESIGTVTEVVKNEAGMKVKIACEQFGNSALSVGGSIAVSGVCLTAVGVSDEGFEADVSNETVFRTSFGTYAPGSKVNLELPLNLAQPLGGHLVSGHVDGLAQCVDVADDGDSKRMLFEIDSELGRYVARKGSVAMDGVSLTVNEVEDIGCRTRFSVNIIPHTLSETTLSQLSAGDEVNIETDLIARYAERCARFAERSID